MIQGVERKSSDGYITYCIMDVSDELKNVIREKLTLICHGRDKADSTRRMYSYKSTVKEFVKRYKENNVLQGNDRRVAFSYFNDRGTTLFTGLCIF